MGLLRDCETLNIAKVRSQLEGQVSPAPLSSGAVLQLTNLTRHHEGLYTCVADNGVGGPVIQTITLTIACKHNCARSINTK